MSAPVHHKLIVSRSLECKEFNRNHINMTSFDPLDAAEKGVVAVRSILKEVMGPRISFIRDSRYEASIRKETQTNRFKSKIASHLERLAVRVSTFRSIAFPNQSLSISTEYEPLLLTFRHEYGLRQTDKGAVALTPEVGSVLIIDRAGMGKTTYVKHYISKILVNHTITPVLIELRTIDFTISKLALKEQIQFELGFKEERGYKDLTTALLEAGKIYLILDGFDEVKVASQRLAATIISDIAREFPNLSVVVTSRPQLVLPQINGSKTLEFAHFEEDQAKQLLLRYDKFIGLDVGKQLVEEFHRIPCVFLENPLTLALLFQSYAVNNTISDRISTFYSEIYTAVFQGHDIRSKENYVRDKVCGLSLEDFRKVLRAFSYSIIARDKYCLGDSETCTQSVSECASLVDEVNFEADKYFLDITGAVPIVILDGANFRFLHKTISEYFAAEYILHAKRREEILVKISSGRSLQKFDVVVDFLIDMEPRVVYETILPTHSRAISKMALEGNWRRGVVETLCYLYPIWLGVFQSEDMSFGEYVGITNDTYFSEELIGHVTFGFEPSAVSCLTFTMNNEHFVLVVATEHFEPIIRFDLINNLMEKSAACDQEDPTQGVEVLPYLVPSEEMIFLESSMIEIASDNSIIYSACLDLLMKLQQVDSRDEVFLLSPARATNFLERVRDRISQEDEIMSLL